MNDMALGITAVLADGGLPPSGIAWWWRRERGELDWRSPREHLLLDVPDGAQRLTELARADIAELRALGVAA